MNAMKRLPRLALCAAIFTALACARAQDLAEISARGKELMAAGKYEEAIPIYRELVKALPGNPGPVMNLGLALHMSRHEQEAATQFQTVIRLAPDHIPAHLFLGVTYFAMKKPELAVRPLQTVLRAEPKNLDARLILAQALFALSRYESAAQQFKKLTELDPQNPKAWNGLGLSYESLATRNFETLEKIGMGSPYWLFLFAETRATVGLYTSSFHLYREAEEKMPGLRGLHKGVAEVYRMIGQPQWAAIEAAKEQSLPPLACGGAVNAAPPGSPQKGAPPPAAAGRLTGKAECEFWAGRYLEAIAATAGRTTVEACFWRVRAYNELARQAFSSLAQIPNSAEVHELLATILFNRKQYPESVTEWQQALKLAPENRYYQERLAIALSSSRDYEKALPLLEGLIQRSPDSVQLNFWLGYTLLSLLETERAVPYLEKAVAIDPSIPAGHKQLASAYIQIGQPEKAVPHLKKALPADDDGSVHYQLSRAYRMVRQPVLASEMLNKFREIEKSPEGGKKGFERLEITAP
jgi:tetratricopeptide (TPR) repeat protein